ncbi:MAG: 2-phosphosulfolactate phosphatase [Gemmatimonadota bacterium]|nr:2-phosphosulfolactate phosphatase [Gemmatimonadota bacterium]
MRLDVLFGPLQLAPAYSTGRVVAVIDVLRLSTTVATALHNGAKAIVPLAEAEEVIMRAKQFTRSDVRLAGERKMLPVPGFDLGNSPGEMTREAVDGMTVLLTTTNGTRALLAVQGARDVVVGAYVNFSAVCALLRTALRGGTDVTLLCAGSDKQFSLEDAACAGRMARYASKRMTGVQLNDGALASGLIDKRYGASIDRLFKDAEHGRLLVDAGFGDDLAACAAIDSCPVIPVYQDRQITKLGPERER